MIFNIISKTNVILTHKSMYGKMFIDITKQENDELYVGHSVTKRREQKMKWHNISCILTKQPDQK